MFYPSGKSTWSIPAHKKQGNGYLSMLWYFGVQNHQTVVASLVPNDRMDLLRDTPGPQANNRLCRRSPFLSRVASVHLRYTCEWIRIGLSARPWRLRIWNNKLNPKEYASKGTTQSCSLFTAKIGPKIGALFDCFVACDRCWQMKAKKQGLPANLATIACNVGTFFELETLRKAAIVGKVAGQIGAANRYSKSDTCIYAVYK